MTNPVGLYIHVPFCDAKCGYCDFVTFTDRHGQIDSYLTALTSELGRYRGWPVQTIFIGGGTPTVLSTEQIDRLMTAVHRTMDTSSLVEATVEANPESATEDRLRAFQAGGINRLSFGLQTTNNALLAKLGRLHDRNIFFERFKMARAIGFKNINVDLMFGLPEQTMDDWTDTLRTVAALEAEHVSAYALKIEPGTRFAKENIAIDGDVEADMYLAASDFLSENGYEHYEISNFCKPNHEAKHNLLYWENKNTVGVGISSTSYIDGRRFKNTAHLQTYIDRMSSGGSVVTEESGLDETASKRESLMLGLRLKKGVAVEQVAPDRTPMAATFLAQGLAVNKKGMYSLTPRGWLLSNQLFQQFV